MAWALSSAVSGRGVPHGAPATRLAKEEGPSAYVAARLRELRAAGWSFDDAWVRTMMEVVRHSVALRSGDRGGDWACAFGATKAAWRAAFDRAPATAAQRAVAMLGDGGRQSRRDGPVLEGDGCAWCGGEIPPDRYSSARHCSNRCRRTHAYERQRLRVGKPAPTRPKQLTLVAGRAKAYDGPAARVTTVR